MCICAERERERAREGKSNMSSSSALESTFLSSWRRYMRQLHVPRSADPPLAGARISVVGFRLRHACACVRAVPCAGERECGCTGWGVERVNGVGR